MISEFVLFDVPANMTRDEVVASMRAVAPLAVGPRLEETVRRRPRAR